MYRAKEGMESLFSAWCELSHTSVTAFTCSISASPSLGTPFDFNITELSMQRGSARICVQDVDMPNFGLRVLSQDHSDCRSSNLHSLPCTYDACTIIHSNIIWLSERNWTDRTRLTEHPHQLSWLQSQALRPSDHSCRTKKECLPKEASLFGSKYPVLLLNVEAVARMTKRKG